MIIANTQQKKKHEEALSKVLTAVKNCETDFQTQRQQDQNIISELKEELKQKEYVHPYKCCEKCKEAYKELLTSHCQLIKQKDDLERKLSTNNIKGNYYQHY